MGREEIKRPQIAQPAPPPAPLPPVKEEAPKGEHQLPDTGSAGLAAAPDSKPAEAPVPAADEGFGEVVLIGTSNAGEPVAPLESASAPPAANLPKRTQAVDGDREQRIEEKPPSPSPPDPAAPEAVGVVAAVGQTPAPPTASPPASVASEAATTEKEGAEPPSIKDPAPPAKLAEASKASVAPKAAEPAKVQPERPKKDAQAIAPPVVAKRTEPKPPRETRDPAEDKFMRQLKITDYLREADQLYQQGDFKGAVRILRRITTKYPDSEDAPRVKQLIEEINKNAGGVVE